METETLRGPNVQGGQRLLAPPDQAGIGIRSALWTYNPDTDVWRLWLTPAGPLPDKRDFYRKAASLMSKHRAELVDLDPGDIELVDQSHAALTSLRRFMRFEGLSGVRVTNNMLDGYSLPDSIILRMT